MNFRAPYVGPIKNSYSDRVYDRIDLKFVGMDMIGISVDLFDDNTNSPVWASLAIGQAG